MSDEQERLKRIREAQLKSRDPGPSKIRNYDWNKHSKLAKREKSANLIEVYLHLPQRWRGALMGFLFGAVIGLLMNMLFLGEDTRLLAFVPVLITLILGFIIGKSMEDPIEL